MRKIILSALIIFIISTTNSIAQVPTTGLIAYYPFTGDVNDQTVNSYNLIGTNITYTQDRFGRLNHAANFDGISSYANRAPFSLKDSFTISVWSKANSLPAAEMVLVNGSSGSDGVSLIIGNFKTPSGSGDTINMFMGGVGVAGNAAIARSYWQHTVIIYKLGVYSVYENDTLAASGSLVMLQPTAQFIIGASKNGSLIKEYFSGSIDDIRIYNRPITTTEVAALYHELPVDVPNISHSEQNIDIYPNPAQNQFTVSLSGNNNSKGTIQLLNSLGQIVIEKYIAGPTNIFDIHNFPSGMYIIKVSDNGQTSFRKIMKE